MRNLTEKEWEKVDNLVESLEISIEEAVKMLDDDKAIDKGEKMFELPADLAEGAKKARRADRKPTTPNRKEDTDKTALMEMLMEAVGEYAPTKTKPGEFLFEYNNRRFKVVLSAPRT